MPILLYHHVTPAPPQHDPYGNCVTLQTFERQIAWLRWRGYRTVPLATLERQFGGVERIGPVRPIAITFDDGYADTYRYAWPVLRRYGFTATVFVVTDAIGADNAFDSPEPEARAPMMTAEELRAARSEGMEIGSHTCSHPASLVPLPEAALMAELARSRAALESLLGAPVRYFAYPHSQVDERVERAVERAGYTLACAGVGIRWSRFRLTRVDPGPGIGATTEARVVWRRLKRQLRGVMR